MSKKLRGPNITPFVKAYNCLKYDMDKVQEAIRAHNELLRYLLGNNYRQVVQHAYPDGVRYLDELDAIAKYRLRSLRATFLMVCCDGGETTNIPALREAFKPFWTNLQFTISRTGILISRLMTRLHIYSAVYKLKKDIPECNKACSAFSALKKIQCIELTDEQISMLNA